MKKTKKTNNELLSIEEHLNELKRRILVSLISLIISIIFSFKYVNFLFLRILDTGKSAGFKFVYITPQEVLIQQLKLGLLLALALILPVIVYETLAFCTPALPTIKFFRSKVFITCTLITLLMLIGMVFAYKVILPFTYNFLCGIGDSLGIQSAISVQEYVSLYITILLCMGLLFELPLLCVTLTKLHVITSDLLKRGNKLAIIVSFILAALITPPDVISQIIVAIPIIMLYNISILLCKIIEKGDKSHGCNN